MAARPLSRSALWRFMLALAGLFAAGSLAVLVLVTGSVSDYVERRVADTISTDLKGFEDIFAAGGAGGLKQAVERRLTADPGRIYLLVDANGELVAGNVRYWPNNLDTRERGVSFRDEQRGRILDGDTRTLPDGSRLLIAHDRAEHDALRFEMLRELALPALAALILALVGGYFLARRAMARIEAMNATCRAVEAGDVAARAPGADTRDEFGELAANINAMLDRIERLMGSVQTLSDHIAHETRTPLARLRARLERARSGPGIGPEASAAFDDAVAETETIIGIFSALLDITAAEAARGDNRGLSPVALDETIASVVDLYEGVAEDRNVRLSTRTEAVTVLGDGMLLMRMIANVVDNAIKFSPPGGEVEIVLVRHGSDALLTVRDEGPGIPAGFEEAAFERFTRADNVRTAPGHGLGLTLVRAIALRHGMKITLDNAGPGLRVSFRAPL